MPFKSGIKIGFRVGASRLHLVSTPCPHTLSKESIESMHSNDSTLSDCSILSIRSTTPTSRRRRHCSTATAYCYSPVPCLLSPAPCLLPTACTEPPRPPPWQKLAVRQMEGGASVQLVAAMERTSANGAPYPSLG